MCNFIFFFFSSRRRHTRWPRDWSSDVCSSDLRPTRSSRGHSRDERERPERLSGGAEPACAALGSLEGLSAGAEPARAYLRPPSVQAGLTAPATMIRLPPFTYLAPRTVDDAARLMAEHGRDAMLVAGGTDLYPNMKRRQFEPKVLVGLRGVRELVSVRGSARSGLSIGSGTTLTAVSRHADVGRHYPALATAAGVVSTPQLRNMGTLGGNVCVDTRCNYYNQSYQWRKAVDFCMKKDGEICLVAPGSPRCWAVSSSDTAPVLWSMGATVTLAGPGGERQMPIAGLYRDDGIVYLSKRPDEVLTEIALPP